MDQLVHLRLGSRDYFGIAVPCIDDRNARKAVQVLTSFVIRYEGAAGLLNHDGRNRFQKAGDDVIAILVYRIRDATFFPSGCYPGYGLQVTGYRFAFLQPANCNSL